MQHLKITTVLLFIWIIGSHSPLFAQKLYFPPINNTQAWDTISPKSLNWCTDQIDNLYAYLQKQDSKAFLVLKDGKIVLEKYFGTFTKDSLWYWASAGKSLTALLIGKAQEEGYLKLNDTSSSYLGKGWTNCTPEQEAQIQIKHQLNMTSGLDDNVPDNHCTADSCLVYLAPAATRWAYHNAPYTLLEKVLEKATGLDINTYTQNKLKNKTGMTGFWGNIGFNNVFFSKARSMARFGLLVQNNCIWESDTLLRDQSYVQQMTQTSQNINLSYGYLWWLNGKNSWVSPGSQLQFPGSITPAAPADMVAAIGKNGQLICISKSTGLVLVRIGNQTNEGEVPYLLCNQIWTELNKVMCSVNGFADEAFNPNNIVVYPNPASSFLNVEYTGLQPNKVIVTDFLGKEMFQTSDIKTIHIADFSDGIYTLHFQFNQFTHTQKWVKQSH
jgi:CubicO group peptidase (beta-lactamase class C family)